MYACSRHENRLTFSLKTLGHATTSNYALLTVIIILKNVWNKLIKTVYALSNGKKSDQNTLSLSTINTSQVYSQGIPNILLSVEFA